MKRAINITEISRIFKNYLLFIIILPLLSLVASIVVTFFLIEDKYVATTQLLINQKENTHQNVQDIQSNIQLINTYSEIVKSPRILGKVAKELKGQYEADEIKNFLNVTNQANTQVLNISIFHNDKEVAEQLANTVANVFKKEIPKIMKVDNVSLLSSATKTGHQVAPNVPLNLFIGWASGLLILCIIIFIKEITDKRIKSEQDVYDQMNLPVLGSIQYFK
ncbi:Wzz/FepE/Etk N-terminal domain-containing protein [Staphylococcus arlettae]|uniref:Capsular polysaccharide biosynthesis protein n=3 Tax=Staphylococcus arlettae TaxID=29378 RepID=A0A380CBL5_9STAP|nr:MULTISPECIES: Wzz/FepE/Etk N-terminal domain-containing protein [Staphylococcus]EJY96251.1 capsular polysaccharide biosynthesis protein [Staphylococcus arlettae CVD059]ERF49214.1 capsular polysaccharide biosynthesis protein CapA [Staphylococcus sp. EGD-HP3]MCD8816784.1 capsule biosynthesis protein CapA [Staphylococcus arlettae]MCD8833715.1 capsule biosynthesis protein CapA [Staphylococcus arlettae]MCD8850262.1 capsule biosynthesis protein CapA [Staphylococcus arlettae]